MSNPSSSCWYAYAAKLTVSKSAIAMLRILIHQEFWTRNVSNAEHNVCLRGMLSSLFPLGEFGLRAIFTMVMAITESGTKVIMIQSPADGGNIGEKFAKMASETVEAAPIVRL
jgi:hypothetical protein